MDTYKDAVALNDLWAAGPARPGSCGRGPIGRNFGARAKHWSVTRSATALTLSDEIRQRFDEFSRSQKDVGQYIVDHLDEAAFHTAEELARRANTSSSTVVRFAQALGFEGFPELQAAARDEYRRARENGNGAGRRGQPAALPDRPDRVRGRAGRRPRERGGDRAQGRPRRGRRGGGPDLARRAHRALRHRPDGLLRQLPAPPADAARPARRGGGLARARKAWPGWGGSTRTPCWSASPPAGRTRWWSAR